MLACHINTLTHFVHIGALAKPLSYAYMLLATGENVVSEMDPCLRNLFYMGRSYTTNKHIIVTLSIVEQNCNLVI